MTEERVAQLLGTSVESVELLLGSMPDIALLVDRHACILYANRAAPEADPRGTLLFDWGFGEEAKERMTRALWSVFEQGEPVSYEVESRDVPGETTAWYLTRWSPVERRGQVVAALVVASDISQRVQLERDLERMSHVGSWEWDTATGGVSWSNELYSIFGVDPETFTPSYESFLERIHPADRDFVAMVTQRTIGQGEPFSIDERIVRPDGEERVLLSSARVEQSPAGTARVVGVCVDITERKAAEDQLERVSRQQEVILASTAEGVLGVDGEGVITFANPAAAEILGWDAEEMRGRDIHDVLHGSAEGAAVHDARHCAVLTALESGVVQYMEDDVFWHRSGASFPVSVTSSPIAERGVLAGAVLTFNDVTERKRFEAQLQYLADHDPTTGLFNRRRFEQELARHLAYDARYHRGGAILILDVDNFKYVNDTLGHKAGDHVIATVARTIRERVRDTDVFARVGGDEFALLLPEAGIEQGEAVANVVLDAVREREITVDGHAVAVSVSIGLTGIGGRERLSGDSLMVEADSAMYAAKDAGRDCYSVYTPVAAP